MVDTDAAAKIDAITRLQLAMMKGTGTGQRGQHFKQHGCVKAQFEVLADIPDKLKVGLFAKPASYTAYVRFSNGRQLDDTNPDIHGMAIKLTGVPGRKVLETEATATTHDFILADNPVFIIRDTDEYVRFMENIAENAAATTRLGKMPLKFMAWLALHHPQDLPVLLRFTRHVQDSPLTARYWSQVPYAFGSGGRTICRYGAVPQSGNALAPIPPAERDAAYLKRAMIDHLAARAAKFDFTAATPRRCDAGRDRQSHGDLGRPGTAHCRHHHPAAEVRFAGTDQLRREPLLHTVARSAGASPGRSGQRDPQGGLPGELEPAPRHQSRGAR